MRDGELQQLGAPNEIYAKPANTFVAGFIGSPAMNFFEASVETEDAIALPFGDAAAAWEDAGGERPDEVVAGIRPQAFEDATLVRDAATRGLVFEAEIEVLESLGSESYAHFRTAGETRGVARLDRASRAQANERATLWVDPTEIHLFAAQGGGERLGAARQPAALIPSGAIR
jgi:multiple sugar transport system ATP-binding protein